MRAIALDSLVTGQIRDYIYEIKKECPCQANEEMCDGRMYCNKHRYWLNLRGSVRLVCDYHLLIL